MGDSIQKKLELVNSKLERSNLGEKEIVSSGNYTVNSEKNLNPHKFKGEVSRAYLKFLNGRKNRQLKNKVARFKKLEKEIHEIDSSIDKCNELIEKTDCEIKLVLTEIDKKNDEKSALERELNERNKELKTKKSSYEENKKHIKKIELEIRVLQQKDSSLKVELESKNKARTWQKEFYEKLLVEKDELVKGNEALSDEIEVVFSDIKQVESLVNELKSDNEVDQLKLEGQREYLDKKRDDLKSTQDIFEIEKQRQADLKEQLKQLKLDTVHIEQEILKNSEDKKDLLQDIEEIQSDYEVLLADKTSLSSSLTHQSKNIDDLVLEKNELQHNLDKEKAEVDRLKSEYDECAQKLDHLEKNLSDLHLQRGLVWEKKSELSISIETVNRNINSLEDHTIQTSKDIESLKEDIQSIETEIGMKNELSEEMSKTLANLQSEFDKLNENYDLKTLELKETGDVVYSKQKQNDKLLNQISEVEMKTVETEKDIKEQDHLICQLETVLKNLTAQKSKLEHEFELVRNDYDSMVIKRDHLEKEVQNTEADQTEKRKEIEDQKSLLLRKEDEIKKIEKHKQNVNLKIERLQSISNVVSLRNKKMDYQLSEIESKTTDLYSRLENERSSFDKIEKIKAFKNNCLSEEKARYFLTKEELENECEKNTILTLEIDKISEEIACVQQSIILKKESVEEKENEVSLLMSTLEEYKEQLNGRDADYVQICKDNQELSQKIISHKEEISQKYATLEEISEKIKLKIDEINKLRGEEESLFSEEVDLCEKIDKRKKEIQKLELQVIELSKTNLMYEKKRETVERRLSDKEVKLLTISDTLSNLEESISKNIELIEKAEKETKSVEAEILKQSEITTELMVSIKNKNKELRKKQEELAFAKGNLKSIENHYRVNRTYLDQKEQSVEKVQVAFQKVQDDIVQFNIENELNVPPVTKREMGSFSNVSKKIKYEATSDESYNQVVTEFRTLFGDRIDFTQLGSDSKNLLVEMKKKIMRGLNYLSILSFEDYRIEVSDVTKSLTLKLTLIKNEEVLDVSRDIESFIRLNSFCKICSSRETTEKVEIYLRVNPEKIKSRDSLPSVSM